MKYSKINKNPRRQHMKIAKMVDRISPLTILDVGCANGLFSVFLAEIVNASVVGIESDYAAASIAATRIKVYVHDLNERLLSENALMGASKFDLIIFADVLEHLVHPDEVLADAANLLQDGGHVIVSIPNVQHFKTRMKIAFGTMAYEDYGPLDRTHLKFFGYQSAMELVDDAGYEIVDTKFSIKPSNWLFEALTRIAPSIFAYQFVFDLVLKSNK